MNFAVPAGLFALLALAVPILLHLARRSEHRVIDFAALRWVQARRRARRRLRVVELVLLALRCLLIATLALLLAAPFLPDQSAQRPWVLVAPGVAAGTVPEAQFRGDAEWRWLAPGFPPFEQGRPNSGAAVSSLLREIDAQLPPTVRMQVQVPEELGGLDGESLLFRRALDWKVLPGRSPGPRGTLARTLESCAVRLDGGSADLAPWLFAAQSAWKVAGADGQPVAANAASKSPVQDSTGPGDVLASAKSPKNAGCLIWLRRGPLPGQIREWVARGGTLLIDPRTTLRSTVRGADDARSVPVVSRMTSSEGALDARAMRMGDGRVVRLVAFLDQAADPGPLDGDFPHRLAAVLQTSTAAPDRAHARDVAPVRMKDAKDGAREQTSSYGKQRSFDAWLIWIAAGLFATERVYALLSRRWRSA